ncbi:MAG: signal peptidase I [Erysipelotrichaceae bacterium]
MSDNNNQTKPTFAQELWDYIKIIFISLISVYLITNFIAKPIRVDGESMYPTLKDNEAGISNVIGVLLNQIDRFDVVIVYEEHTGNYWVKRIVGLPGETVSYKDEQLYINGKAVDEPFLDTAYVADTIASKGYFTQDFTEITLGSDEYFLLGDNRPNSSDSRYRGAFHRDDIVAKDVLIVYPFSEIGIVSNGK